MRETWRVLMGLFGLYLLLHLALVFKPSELLAQYFYDLELSLHAIRLYAHFCP